MFIMCHIGYILNWTNGIKLKEKKMYLKNIQIQKYIGVVFTVCIKKKKKKKKKKNIYIYMNKWSYIWQVQHLPYISST